MISLTSDLINDSNQESQHDESTWREHKEQNVISLGQQSETEDGPRAQHLTADAQQGETKGETTTNANAVEQRGNG